MKKMFCCFLFLLLMVFSINGGGGFGGHINVRGQLLWPSRGGFPSPSVGTKVHLIPVIPTRGYFPTAITDYNGMYYLYGVIPNNYMLQVSRNGTIIGQYRVIIPFNAPVGQGIFFDISPIVLQ